MRGTGLPSLLGELPDPVVVVFALVTQLGDVWFLTLLVTVTYWAGPHLPRVGDAIERERAAVVVGVLLTGFVVVTVGKPWLGLPRPSGAGRPPAIDLIPRLLEPLYAWLSTGSGFGFPSGHAIGSTTAFGGLAWAIRTDRPRRRLALAAGLIAVVSLSRLVLGLHFLVDVLAGIGLGVVALAIATALGEPARVFGLATALGVAGLVLVGTVPEVLLNVGVAAGAMIAWLASGDALARSPTREGAVATVALGGVTVGPTLVIAAETALPTPVVGLLGFVGGVLIVAMPLVGERVAKKGGVVQKVSR